MDERLGMTGCKRVERHTSRQTEEEGRRRRRKKEEEKGKMKSIQNMFSTS